MGREEDSHSLYHTSSKTHDYIIRHRNGVKFFAGDVHGFFGYSFMDLVEHEFAEEVAVKPKEEDNNGATPAKKAKKDNEDETKMVKRSVNYVSLEEALAVDWTAAGYAKRVRIDRFRLN